MKDAIIGGVIGIITSLIASILFIRTLFLFKPKIIIYPKISIKNDVSGKPIYRFKIINNSNRQIINIKAELHLIEPYDLPGGRGMHTTKITLKRSEVLCLVPKNKADDSLHFDFRFLSDTNIHEIWKDNTSEYLRLQVLATDSFSNYSQVFCQLYRDKPTCFVEGDFGIGSSHEI